MEAYPKSTIGLKNLKKLYIGNRIKNSITNLGWSFFFGLKGRGNKIKELPVLLASSNLSVLELDGNPIVVPPKYIWQQGLYTIKRYFMDLAPGGEFMCADTINIIGDSCAGKTSIALSVRSGLPQPAESDDRTHVMNRLVARLNDKSVIINDFGGHEVYHSVIPIFLPSNGLVVLAYDMSEDFDSLKKKVQKWMITVIAKCPSIRLILAGTRADKVDPRTRIEHERSLSQFVIQILSDAKGEVEYHMAELKFLQHQSISPKKWDVLQAILLTLESADVSVVTLSCTADDAEQGLQRLRNLISVKLQQPLFMPASWCPFLNDIVRRKASDEDPCPCLKWAEIEDLAKRLLPKGSDDITLKANLRYLSSSSQIIWLEDHPELRLYIFYQPKLVADMLKNVLYHHDSREMQAKISSNPYYKSYQEEYIKGYLSKPFLAHLLGRADIVDNVVQLMMHFNLLGEVADSAAGGKYIVPSILPQDPPPEFGQPPGNSTLRPSVCVRLTFVGSLIPMAFFETSFASIATWTHSMKAEPHLWKHGISLRHDKISLIFRRFEINDVLELLAFSEHEDQNIWEVLTPILACIRANVTSIWKGAPPGCAIVCPACWYVPPYDSIRQPGQRATTLDELTSFEQTINTYWYCNECKTDVPPCLCFPRPSGPASKEDIRCVAKFMETLRSKIGTPDREGSKEAGTEHRGAGYQEREGRLVSKMQTMFEKAHTHLIAELLTSDVLHIADRLYQDICIDRDQYERIQVKAKNGTHSEVAKCLVDIFKLCADEAIGSLLAALESDVVDKAWLAQRVRDIVQHR